MNVSVEPSLTSWLGIAPSAIGGAAARLAGTAASPTESISAVLPAAVAPLNVSVYRPDAVTLMLMENGE